MRKMVTNALFEEKDLLHILDKKHNKKGYLTYEEDTIFKTGNYVVKSPKVIYSYKPDKDTTIGLYYYKSDIKKLLLGFLKCKFKFIYDVRIEYSRGEVVCYLWNTLKGDK